MKFLNMNQIFINLEVLNTLGKILNIKKKKEFQEYLINYLIEQPNIIQEIAKK